MWCVVYTHAQKESFAQSHLEQQGFKTYLPCFQQKKRLNNQSTSIKVLFPRYLFVQIDPSQIWRPILSTRGVQTLLMTSKLKPQTLPNSFIDSLKAIENENGLIEIQLPNKLRPGTSIRINQGGFEGQVGKIITMDTNERIKILINILGTQTEITTSEDKIEAI
ncbi:MAG: transcription termination/antitermination NusG family protein [Gammaproteobacteria bacterium]|nr:transcription termination/antitermination NusG family protein [Gammaproteobacteria bacterium]